MELTREIRDKRVAIARDIIKQIDTQAILLQTGSYLATIKIDPPIDGDLQEHVDLIQQNCTACMLGAALLSKARLFNGVPMRRLDRNRRGGIDLDREPIVDLLGEVFDRGTLNLLESAFEHCAMGENALEDGLEAAEFFGDQFDAAHVRARAIAQVLIDNDGEFILPAEKDHVDA